LAALLTTLLLLAGFLLSALLLTGFRLSTLLLTTLLLLAGLLVWILIHFTFLLQHWFEAPPDHAPHGRNQRAAEGDSSPCKCGECLAKRGWNPTSRGVFLLHKGEPTMGRYLLLWLLGIPIPILVLIWLFGGLH
jgi:hypothetical protein